MKKEERVAFAHKIAKMLKVAPGLPCNLPREIIVKLDVRTRKDGFIPGWTILIDEKKKSYTLTTNPLTN